MNASSGKGVGAVSKYCELFHTLDRFLSKFEPTSDSRSNCGRLGNDPPSTGSFRCCSGKPATAWRNVQTSCHTGHKSQSIAAERRHSKSDLVSRVPTYDVMKSYFAPCTVMTRSCMAFCAYVSHIHHEYSLVQPPLHELCGASAQHCATLKIGHGLVNGRFSSLLVPSLRSRQSARMFT